MTLHLPQNANPFWHAPTPTAHNNSDDSAALQLALNKMPVPRESGVRTRRGGVLPRRQTVLHTLGAVLCISSLQSATY